MIKEIDSMYRSATHQLGVAVLAGMGLLMSISQANATCNVVVSAPSVQLGRITTAGLKTASIPGYHSIGSKNQVVNVNCDVSQTTFRIALDGFTPVIGTPLVLWGSVGAMQVRVMKASVAGTPVNMKLEGAPSSIYTEGVNLIQNDVLNLDLSGVPLQNRKSLSLQLQLTGLLPDTYIVRSEVTLNSNISVHLVGAQ